MINAQNPFLSVKKEKNSFIIDSFWPSRKLPQSFQISNHDYDAWGYIVDYDDIGGDKLAQLLFEGKEKELSLLKSDFIVAVNYKNKTLFRVMVGLSGLFPLYFAKENDEIMISPNFGEIFRKVKEPSLNIDETLDYLSTDYNFFATDKTFIQQIRRLSPGCLLEIKEDFNFQIREPFKWKEVISKEETKSLLEPNEFVKQLFNELEKRVDERLSVLSTFGLACDLSSGFDCDLVAYQLKGKTKKIIRYYSGYTSLNNDDTDPSLVRKFAQKYGLSVQLFDTKEIVAFMDQEDLGWTVNEFFPSGHYQPIMLRSEKRMSDDNQNMPVAHFTGFGGDEFYHSYGILEEPVGQVDTEYDFAKLVAKSDGDKILTSKALEIFLDKKRFENKKFYNQQFGSFAVGFAQFPVSWKLGTWLVNPYVDIEMIKLAQKLPKINGKPIHKQQLLKGRENIFLPEQYRLKLPFGEQIKQVFDKRKDFLVKILENSVLEKLGMVKASELREHILKGDIKEYIGKVHLMFINLIRLEIFLQANKVNKVEEDKDHGPQKIIYKAQGE